MKAPERIVTERLVLRRWREDDVAAIARLNGDAEVMRFFPRPYGYEETKARLAVWTAAFFWVFAMVVGNPDGTDRKDDGRAAVLGVNAWWTSWLDRCKKQ